MVMDSFYGSQPQENDTSAAHLCQTRSLEILSNPYKRLVCANFTTFTLNPRPLNHKCRS